MRIFCLGLLALALAAGVSADTLTIKQNFPMGWQYSTDARHFQSAGFYGSRLKTLMADDSIALAHLDSYKALQEISVASLAYGLGVGTWMLVKVAKQDWHKDDHLALSISAGAAVLLCGILQSVSDQHFKRAVEHYNAARRPAPTEGMKVKVCLLDPPASGLATSSRTRGGVTLGLKLRF